MHQLHNPQPCIVSQELHRPVRESPHIVGVVVDRETPMLAVPAGGNKRMPTRSKHASEFGYELPGPVDMLEHFGADHDSETVRPEWETGAVGDELHPRPAPVVSPEVRAVEAVPYRPVDIDRTNLEGVVAGEVMVGDGVGDPLLDARMHTVNVVVA